MAKEKRGADAGKPFVESDEMVFATGVLPDSSTSIGFRGEAVEGELRPSHGAPKGYWPEDPLFSKSGKSK